MRQTTVNNLFIEVLTTREEGVTAKEARERVGQHHGAVSGALSNLHREGYIARLAERRDGYKIYVHPAFTKGRRTEAQGR